MEASTTLTTEICIAKLIENPFVAQNGINTLVACSALKYMLQEAGEQTLSLDHIVIYIKI